MMMAIFNDVYITYYILELDYTYINNVFYNISINWITLFTSIFNYMEIFY